MRTLTLKDFNLENIDKSILFFPPTCQHGKDMIMNIERPDDMEVYHTLQVFIDKFLENYHVLGGLIDKEGKGYLYVPLFNSFTTSDNLLKTFKEFYDLDTFDIVLLMQELEDGAFRFIYK